MPDNTLSTLTQIENKVRRLTRSPSTSQLSQLDLDSYINTFLLYDFPEHLRTFFFRQTFSFTCQPYQDVYPLFYNTFNAPPAFPTTNPLFNFLNIYTTIHSPVYIAGYNSFYSQSREQFFGIYPLTNSIVLQQTGDGVTTTFTGTITNLQGNIIQPGVTQSTALLQNNVTITSLTSTLEGLSLVDVPVVDAATGWNTVNGNLYVPGQLPSSSPTAVTPNNTVNYATGVYTITFPTAPGVGQPINAQTVPQVISIPQAMLYYDNKITLRPVPDQPYKINFEVYVRPIELIGSSAQPQLSEFWQYIALGAARKIFQDRMDLESVALIDPEYKLQERLCLRRTIVQNTNERTATIYTEQTGNGAGAYGSGLWFGGGQF